MESHQPVQPVPETRSGDVIMQQQAESFTNTRQEKLEPPPHRQDIMAVKTEPVLPKLIDEIDRQ